MSAWNDPWSTGFDWGTVEADPDLSAALQERTDQRDALKQRLDELKNLAYEESHRHDRGCMCGVCLIYCLALLPVTG